MKKFALVICGVCLFSSIVVAQSTLPKGVAAVVNGKQISEALLEQNVKDNVAQGVKDSPELRRALVTELVNRELLSQDANKKGLDSNAEVKLQLEQLRQNFLADLALNEYFSKNPVKEEQLKAEYDLQLKSLGDVSGLQQYKLSQILLADEASAKKALLRLKKESFDKVAKEVSIDETKSRGGEIGWVLPNQILPALANVMVNLGKGSVSVMPIQTPNGWHIIKVEDKRAFKAPSYEESKNRIMVAITQKMRNEYIAQLRKDAKINP